MRGRLLPLLVLVSVVIAGIIGAEETRLKDVTGLVIAAGEDGLEIKRGGAELKFYWDQATRFAAGDREILPQSIRVCQLVAVSYEVTERGNRIVRLTLLKDSYCTK